LIAEERLCLSTQILQELYVTLTKKLGIRTELALGVLADLSEYPVFVIDPTAIREAGRLAGEAQLSFWDALMVVAARRMAAEVLLTEEWNAGQRFGTLRVENPFRLPQREP
jgi:predicted nucleic acid-binding protein